MASKSGDGHIITRWLENNGYLVARGSTTRGGSEALRQMVRQVRSGHNVALTVDGPRGPARVVQAGVVRLAQMTKAWILPISFSSSSPLFLASWDRQLVPKPFSRNFVAYGEPFAIPSDMPDDAALAKIRIALDEVTAEADAHAGTRPPSRRAIIQNIRLRQINRTPDSKPRAKSSISCLCCSALRAKVRRPSMLGAAR